MTPQLLRYTGADDRAAEVTRAWEGRTVALVCAGPSLTLAQLQLLKQREVPAIAVNDAYLVAPWADVLYFADAGWYFWHAAGIARKFDWTSFTADEVRHAFAGFRGQKATIRHEDTAPAPDLFVMGRHGPTPEGLSDDPRELHTGLHSGYQALDMLALSRPARILLVGCDLRFVEGRSHAHQGHVRPQKQRNLDDFVRMYRTVERPLQERGIEVVNCTPGSALTRFRFSTLEQELAAVTA